jgi:uncharacterized protein with NRDE domain
MRSIYFLISTLLATMCLLFLSIDNHPNYKLVLAGNRDEFYNRKTAAAQFWHDNENILGGRDLVAGGTWLAMTKQGRIGMVTNYRDPQNIKSNAPSRGHLVSDFLAGDESTDTYLRRVSENGKMYNGFNLIIGDKNDLSYYSNYREGVEKLAPGFYGLSNHLLETAWPKVARGKERITPVIERAVIDPEKILDALYDDHVADDNVLPVTGLPLAQERALSSMFIKMEGYGSRCSTVILIDKADQVLFTERVYNTSTFDHTTSSFRFSL